MTKVVSVSQYSQQPNVSKYLEATLKERKADFVANLIALQSTNKALAECAPQDLIKCAMNATALNLPLNSNLGYAYVVPYKNKGVTEPQFQIGYKGFIQLALRTGQYKTLIACDVREGEIKRNKFTGEIQMLDENPDGEVVGFMAYMKLMNGFETSIYMSVSEVQAHGKKYSRSYGYQSSPWQTDFPAMAKKTVLKGLLSTYGMLSTEMTKAYENDNENSTREASAPKTDRSEGVEDAVVVQSEPTETAAPTQPKTISMNDL